MSHIVHFRHRAAVSTALATAATALLVGSIAASSAGASTPRSLAPFPSKNVTFSGHGWGPGWGMGQWGAFGYAAAHKEPYAWILTHYYGGTSMVHLSIGRDSRVIKVSIEENAGHPVVVTSDSAFTVKSGSTTLSVPAGDAVRSVLSTSGSSAGTWTVSRASGCSATGWKVLGRGLRNPTAVPASSVRSAPASELLQLCRADGHVVTYRGDIEAVDYVSGGQHLARTVNLVPLEQYVRDVMPTEVPSGWGTLPSGSTGQQSEPYGFQALEAQAVAVRTYVLAQIAGGGWFGYADICDDYCQGYSVGIGYESQISTLAQRDTTGEVMIEKSGGAAPTQYGSSTGGYTLATPSFPAVTDAGDSVCVGGRNTLGCNPWHDWSATVPVTAVEQAFPQESPLANVQVTKRNGLGSGGGRVLSIEVVGTNGKSASVSGDTWQADFGFDSDWFSVTDGPGATRASGGAPRAVEAVRSGASPASSPVASPVSAGPLLPVGIAGLEAPGGRPGDQPPVPPLTWLRRLAPATA